MWFFGNLQNLLSNVLPSSGTGISDPCVTPLATLPGVKLPLPERKAAWLGVGVALALPGCGVVLALPGVGVALALPGVGVALALAAALDGPFGGVNWVLLFEERDFTSVPSVSIAGTRAPS